VKTSANERLALLGEIAAEIAHELRNALQIISTSAYVAKAASEKAPAQLERISRTTAGAQKLIDDLLDLARGDGVAREAVDVLGAVVDAREHMDPDRLVFVDEVDLALHFPLHPRLFARVLSILFDNALAVSGGVPKITTRAFLRERELVVDVEDDGPGVPPGLGDRIFDPLVRGRAGGTGLGLSLASRIVRAHGGSLSLETHAPAGARFRVVLPWSDA
jgi:two-component system, OmpR family, sensor histidine kinase MtrB